MRIKNQPNQHMQVHTHHTRYQQDIFTQPKHDYTISNKRPLSSHGKYKHNSTIIQASIFYHSRAIKKNQGNAIHNKIKSQYPQSNPTCNDCLDLISLEITN